MGTSVVQLHGTGFCQQLEQVWEWILPQNLLIKAHIEFGFVEAENPVEPTQTSGR